MMNQSNTPGGFENLDVPVYDSPQQEIDRIFQATMQKAGLSGIARRPRKRLILLAAVIATGLLTAAATYLSASDVFRGHLNEYGGPDASVPLSSLSPIVDQTGTTLNVEPSSSDGIRVTPQAIAGDDSTFILLLALETVDGSPLGLITDDGSVSDGFMQFFDTSLSLPSGEFDRVFSESMEFSADGSSGIILQRFNLYEPVPMGESMHIELGNLWQQATLPGDEVGLGRGTLREVLSGFPAENGADALTSVQALKPASISGVGLHLVIDEMLALKEDSEFSLPLTGTLDGYTLTNAAVHEGWLYLRGSAPLDAPLASDLRNIALSDSTGRVVRASVTHFGNRDDSGVMPWGLAFQGVDSVDKLADFSLLAHCGEGIHPYAQGSWSFEIPLNYDSASREFTPNATMSLNGTEGTLTKLVISPYRISFDFLPSSDTVKATMEALDYPYPEVRLTTKDGNHIVPSILDYSEVSGPGGSAQIRGFFYINDIIDPNQVEMFHIGDSVYGIN